ncbi:sensor histidine kinase [Metabacillus litoralis]|uniref:sensor histidine kinase n=1 Tax=Metabacillus litoralis TaxID=152268 RepID=UPI001CFD6DCB|nr:ATP-binding protein [Metabacillus litoralis]
MFKQKMFRKQQATFMILNMIAFTIIFTIFGVIIFGQVQRTLFSQTDEELVEFKNMIVDSPMKGEKLSPKNQNDNEPDRNPPPEDQRRINPRIIVLHFNNNGIIINQAQIGTLIYENYLQDYTLDKTNLNTITNLTIDEQFHFRSLSFKDTTTENDIAYTQLLINIDGEQTILNNFGKLIIICSFIFIILSISASYLLSKRMMKPIIYSWNKQAEFVENASHELRTPLTIIQNKLELLLTQPHEKIINKFENIALSLSETRRLSKLTTDLLTLARADSDTPLMKESLAIDSFIEKASAPYVEIAESQDKHFWLNLGSRLQLSVDEVRFHQLLVILLDNALKYTSENDSIGIKTYVEDQRFVLEVTDTGIGIKEENIQHIFDRFYREDRARSRDSGGSGLGLSIAQWIVNKHDGTIKVIRHPQKGTTFKIKLPK